MKEWKYPSKQCCARWLVLPTVYSDALSYGEQLDKFCYALNQIIENNNFLPTYVQQLIREYISSGAIAAVVQDIIGQFILNVKYPPEGITPAVGDGSTDDTEAIQGCIDYAFNNGGMAVYFPSGSYLTQPLTLRSRTALFGLDRYTTRLVMRGGATTAMFTGDVNELTLVGLGFDGNMDIQVNNVDLFDISVDSAIISNCLLTDGYVLLNITVNNDLQLNDIIFNHAVTNALVLSGNGYAQGCNLIFKSVSSLMGDNFVVLNNNNSILEQLKFEGESPKGITVNGSNNVVKLWDNNNIITPYDDNGDNNSFHVYTKSESQKLTGTKTITVGQNSAENVTGNKTITVGQNSTENVTGNKTITVGQNSTENVTGNKEVDVRGSLTETIKGALTEINTGHTETITGDDTKTVTGTVSETSKNKEVTAISSYIERGFNKTETFTGAKNETLGSSQENITGDKVITAANSTETIQGRKTLNAGDYSETVKGTKTVKVTENYTVETDGNKNESIGIKGIVTAPDYQLKIANHLTYETPQKLNDYFKSIKLKDETGNIYDTIVSGISEPNVLIVGLHFETINEAVEYAKTYCGVNNRVLILILPGKYNESITLNPNPGIDFMGVGKVVWTSDVEYPLASLFTIGPCYVGNITFEQLHSGSYSVHIEAQNVDVVPSGEMLFDNCKFNQQLGAGLGENVYLHLKNCEFNSTLYVHNYPRPASNIGMNLRVENCIFSGANTHIRIDDSASLVGVNDIRSYLFLSFINNFIANNVDVPFQFVDANNPQSNPALYLPASMNIALLNCYGNNAEMLNTSLISLNGFSGVNIPVSNETLYALFNIGKDLSKYKVAVSSVTVQGVGSVPTPIAFSTQNENVIVSNKLDGTSRYCTANLTLTPIWKK